MTKAKDDVVRAMFPGPNVGPEALAGTLHPQLGRLEPHEDGRPRLHAFPKRKGVFVEQAIDAGLLGRLQTSAQADAGDAGPARRKKGEQEKGE